MSILAIDTVGTSSSIAIIDYDGNYFVEHSSASNSHAESFFRILDTLFNKHSYDYDKIDHLAVVVGPGSFTGIRVGISAAQGMSIAANKPLYGVNALEVQAYAISLLCENNERNIRSIIKNTQGFYTQLFDANLLPLSKPEMISKAEPSYAYLDPSVSYSDDKRGVMFEDGKIDYKKGTMPKVREKQIPEWVSSQCSDTGIQPKLELSYRDCNLPKLDASHAGLLVRYRLENKQELNEAEALYLNKPQYI